MINCAQFNSGVMMVLASVSKIEIASVGLNCTSYLVGMCI